MRATEFVQLQGMSSKFLNVTLPASEDSDYIDGDMKPIAMGSVVQSFVSARGRTRYRVVTPSVKAAVQEHFGCASLQGALLEDDFSDGSVSSHWDQRLFEGEIMDPVAGQNSLSGRHVISNATLSLLRDTGWCATHLHALQKAP